MKVPSDELEWRRIDRASARMFENNPAAQREAAELAAAMEKLSIGVRAMLIQLERAGFDPQEAKARLYRRVEKAIGGFPQ